MSSLTVSTIVCSEVQPSRSRVGIEHAHERGARLARARPREMAERRAREHLGVARDLFGFRLSVVVREVGCAIDRQVDLDALARGADGFEAALARVLLVVDDGPARHA